LIRDYLKSLGRGEDAEDLTQEFFARKFLRDSFLQSVHRGTGSFRKFLKLCVKRFLIDHTRRRVQPGGQAGDVVLGVGTEDGGIVRELGSGEPSADREMDRAWARAIIARARERLEAEFVRANKVELGASFLRELDEETGLPSHAAIAERLGMTPGAVTTSFYRFRERMKFLVRAEVESTVADRSDLEDELRGLREAFASGDATGRLVEG
jgi:DNA-directed RNA polymerase specialized sigma24 family protein